MRGHAVIVMDDSPRSTGGMLRDVAMDVQELLRSEVRLAKAEVGEQADRVKSAAGLMGAAAAMALLAGICLVVGGIAVLARVMPVWAAALIMGFLLGAAGAVLYARGRDRLNDFHAMPESLDCLKEDISWVKQRIR